MGTVKILVVVGMAVLLAGCPTGSLQPLYTEQDLIFDPGLVGTWTNKDGKETWDVKRSGEKSYDVLCTVEGEPHWFKLHLLQLGVYRFLDLYPKEKLSFKNGFFASHWIPAHMFYRIRNHGDVLQVAGVDNEFLMRLIAAKKTRIAQKVDDEVGLTGSTKELQEYVLRYVEVQEAFTGPEEYHRVK
jgi:hypothetical protein